MERVLAASGPDRVAALAQAPVQTSEASMRSVLPRAGDIEEAIRTADWPLFEAVWMLHDHRKGEAARIRSRVVEILSADEHAVALKPALDEQRGKAIKLLSERVEPPLPPPPPPPVGPEIRVIAKDNRKALDAQAAKDVLRRVEKSMAEHPGARLDIDWRVFKQEGD
jgi:hypothetical protein